MIPAVATLRHDRLQAARPVLHCPALATPLLDPLRGDGWADDTVWDDVDEAVATLDPASTEAQLFAWLGQQVWGSYYYEFTGTPYDLADRLIRSGDRTSADAVVAAAVRFHELGLEWLGYRTDGSRLDVP